MLLVNEVGGDDSCSARRNSGTAVPAASAGSESSDWTHIRAVGSGPVLSDHRLCLQVQESHSCCPGKEERLRDMWRPAQSHTASTWKRPEPQAHSMRLVRPERKLRVGGEGTKV